MKRKTFGNNAYSNDYLFEYIYSGQSIINEDMNGQSIINEDMNGQSIINEDMNGQSIINEDMNIDNTSEYGEYMSNDELISSLSNGQKELLKTIKPLNEWIGELREYYFYDNWDMIDETFWQKNKTITFDQFYYAGKDMTFVNNDIHLVGKLNLLVKRIKNNINNTHYHEIAERIITNYRINDISYEHAYNNLNTILKE